MTFLQFSVRFKVDEKTITNVWLEKKMNIRIGLFSLQDCGSNKFWKSDLLLNELKLYIVMHAMIYYYARYSVRSLSLRYLVHYNWRYRNQFYSLRVYFLMIFFTL